MWSIFIISPQIFETILRALMNRTYSAICYDSCRKTKAVIYLFIYLLVTYMYMLTKKLKGGRASKTDLWTVTEGNDALLSAGVPNTWHRKCSSNVYDNEYSKNSTRSNNLPCNIVTWQEHKMGHSANFESVSFVHTFFSSLPSLLDTRKGSHFKTLSCNVPPILFFSSIKTNCSFSWFIIRRAIQEV